MKKKLFLFSVLLTIFFGTQVNASINPYMGNLKAESIETEATTLVAQKWSEETDLPGLGLKKLNDNGYSGIYTVLLEDGVTTLGLYKDANYLYVTGINTTVKEVTIPKNVTINDVVEVVDYFGKSNLEWDWSGATSLTKLYSDGGIYSFYANFSNSNITDLYVNRMCYFTNSNSSGLSNIYLHVPYGYDRNEGKNNYGWNRFKRVLVGDETPEYPVPSYSHWVIPGENEGEYFGIYRYEYYTECSYYITEIFTDKDSVSLPTVTPTADSLQVITYFGREHNSGSGVLCEQAPNLKTVTVPATYDHVYIDWSSNPIRNIYMQGNVPYTYWYLYSYINVYPTEEYYWGYKYNNGWEDASIIPYGWDYEWITVNVSRKGEFAQTYIEMTDADWSLGVNVKVTGTLNETDLQNINNLTNLRKLDLSEAEFTDLPSSFLSWLSELYEVVLPSSLAVISSDAFYNCSRLHKVTAPGVKSVGSYAFYKCENLADFDLSNVTTINSRAFYDCSSFNPTMLSADLRYLGEYAFYNTAITEVTIPEGITTINSSVFYDCKQLQKVTLPNSITLIDGGAFYGCSNLVEINIPEGVNTIGGSAFYDCTSLVEINIPEGVNTIEYSAFYNCNKITEITLPSTLQSIGSDVFDNCTSLTTVKCKAIVPPVTNGEFTYNVDLNHCTLYIAPFTIDAYRAASNWDRFYIMKPLDEPVKNIYINRPMTFDLLSEDNAVLQENPNMTLDCNSRSYVGQLSASGDGTLSAGVFSIYHQFYRRTQSSSDIRTTLVNNAENMRADSVTCSIQFEKNYWHFISFQYDVKMEDIIGLNNTDFVIRRYNGANRASGDGSTSNWEQLSAGDVLEAGKGYIIQAANNSYDENGSTNAAVVRFPSRNTVTKNRLFTSNNVIVPLEEYPAEFAHNRSWNLVGNPYPCYYDMHCLEEDFTTPIILWRGTSYQAYSPVDDDIILRPNEAFFIQRPLDAAQMVFGADGRMHFSEAYNKSVTPGIKIAPMRSEGAKSVRSVFNFNIAGCGSDDRTRIVINEDASMEYEISCDASKFFAEASAGAEIYVDGAVKYDICERPLADGTAALGIRIAKDGEYTISLSGRSMDGWTVILKDTETGAIVDLTENAYTFKAEAGTYQNRFELTFKTFGTTAIDNTIVTKDDTNVRIINTSGVTVYEGNIEEFKANAGAGVYVVVDSEKTYKIVIK
ncbi:MAG: leucine-rich repeat domain-containing protein [Bacteroidales bacterium]|nr:leucine-rich repeat domain-containing protein [Bacteroidales bacterium]